MSFKPDREITAATDGYKIVMNAYLHLLRENGPRRDTRPELRFFVIHLKRFHFETVVPIKVSPAKTL